MQDVRRSPSGVVDFPDYPPGLGATDVIDVIPAASTGRVPTGIFRGCASFDQCFHV
jgi:hypothetical protein